MMGVREWWDRRQQRRFYKLIGHGDEYRGRQWMSQVLREVLEKNPKTEEEYRQISRQAWEEIE